MHRRSFIVFTQGHPQVPPILRCCVVNARHPQPFTRHGTSFALGRNRGAAPLRMSASVSPPCTSLRVLRHPTSLRIHDHDPQRGYHVRAHQADELGQRGALVPPGVTVAARATRPSGKAGDSLGLSIAYENCTSQRVGGRVLSPGRSWAPPVHGAPRLPSGLEEAGHGAWPALSLPRHFHRKAT